jgi:hypothetical protein
VVKSEPGRMRSTSMNNLKRSSQPLRQPTSRMLAVIAVVADEHPHDHLRTSGRPRLEKHLRGS